MKIKKTVELDRDELNIFTKTVDELRKWLFQFLKKHGYKNIMINDDYILAKSDLKEAPTLCTHMDTVWEETPLIYNSYYKNTYIYWGERGLGADDRAGIVAIKRVIEAGFRPHIIFTNYEEIGGQGAIELVMNHIAIPLDTPFVIELDREGKDDAVFYNCTNEDFKKYILSFGFKEKRGTFSDIYFIGPGWDIATVNISTGYYNEHTVFEYLNMKDFNNMLFRLEKILKDNLNNKVKYYGHF